MASPRLALALALSGLGCMSAGNFPQLPQQEQSRFLRCRASMQPALCGDDHDTVYVTNCIRSAESTYADQHGASARKAWLIEQGCPPPMVSPVADAE